MSNYNNLKEYFETTSKEQVLKDWNDCKEYDNMGIKIDDFVNTIELNQIISNWTTTDQLIYKTPEIKFKSLQEAKTKVIAKQ